jgi:hypothetical protein
MNRAQEIQLLRLELGSFHGLDGSKVACDLKDHETLWDSFVFGRFLFHPLIELRDLNQGFINADTLYLLTKKDRLSALLKIVEQWKADEVGWRTSEICGGTIDDKSSWDLLGAELDREDALVRVWWD